MNRRRFVLITTLVIFVLVLMLASPTPMGEVEQQIAPQVYDEDMPDLIRQFASSELLANDIVHILEHVEVTAASTGDVSLGYATDLSKAFFMWSMRADVVGDSDNDYALSLHWKSTSEITWVRAGTSDADFWLSIWVVTFTSGIEVWELGPFSAIGLQNIGDTVIMSDTFVINNGWTDTAYGMDDDYPVVYLASTTQIDIDTYDSSSTWANLYVQVVEGADLTVQRGIEVDPATDPIDITVSAVTIDRTQIFVQSSCEYGSYPDTSGEAYLSDTTSLIIDRVGTWIDRDYYWELVEWPVGVTIQHVSDTLTTTASGTTAITSVDTTKSVALLEGFLRGLHMGTLHESSGYDYIDGYCTTDFLSSTSVNVSRGIGGDTIEFRVCVITFPFNDKPHNEEFAYCVNADDGDNLYAMYKTYLFTANVSDAQGYGDIDWVEVWARSVPEYVTYWKVRYDEDTNVFSVETGDVTIDQGASSYVKSGNYLDVTFGIKIDWAHDNLADCELFSWVEDSLGEYDNDPTPHGYDFETRLDLSPFSLADPYGTPDRGDFDYIGGITASGTVIYYGSGDNYPLSDQVDVWVLCAEVGTSPWSDLVLSSGQFSMAVSSDDVIGLDTYTFKVVLEGLGSGGTDQLATTHTATYEADRLVLKLAWSDEADNRTNINEGVWFYGWIQYDYDDSNVTDGVQDLEYGGVWKTCTHVSGGTWKIWEEMSESTVTAKTVNDVHGSTSYPNEHGVYLRRVVLATVTVIWDRVQVQSYSASDTRDDINDNVNIDVTLWYDYDNALVVDGYVTINGYSAAHQGSGVWRITRTSAVVTSVTYNNVQCSGNQYGITLVNQNGQSQLVIWDQVYVVSLSYTGSPDTRINAGTSINFDWELHYDYDESDVSDGTTTINGYSCSYQGSGVWRYTTDNSGGVGDLALNTIVTSGNVHGIISVNQNGKTVTMIWDRIKILTTSATSQYIDKGTESTTINVTAELEYDSQALGSGDTLYMNDTLMTWDINHFYIIFGPYDVFNSWLLFVNSSGANEATYSITVVNLNGQSDTVATDQIKVISYSPSDPHDNVNDWIWVVATLQYESDSSQVVDGTVVINGYSYTHIGSGQWRHNRTESTVTGITFDTVVTSGNARSITLVNQNGQSQLVIWDQVVVQTTVADDSRININDNVEIRVTLWLDYYDDYLGSGDTVTLDDVAMTWDSTNSWFDLSRSKSSVGLWQYYVNSSSEATYGITAFDVNNKYVNVIWDRVQVQSYSASDTRDDINDNVNIDVTLWYDYDNALVVDGYVTINGYSAAHQGSGVWRITRTSATVTSVTYNTVAASGNAYGITTVDQNGQSQQVIWDEIIFSMSVNMTWTVVGYYANVSWTVIYDYDDTDYLGTETVYNTGGVLTYSTVGNRTFYVTSIDDSAGYDLTEFTTNTVWCVWDDIDITSGPDYYWTQYSIDAVWLIWGAPSTYAWTFNDTDWLQQGAIMQSYKNLTADAKAAIWSPTGDLGGLAIGPFDPSWYYVNLTINCEVTIGSTDYDFQIWSAVLIVDILHSIHIADSGMDVQDTWITFYFHTNWGNSTFYVWDNDTLIGGSLEGWYQVVKPTTIGLHNFTILVNGTQESIDTSKQTKDFSSSNSWEWLNFKFTVNPVTLTITYGRLGVAYDEVSFSGSASKPADVTIYEDDVQVGITSISTGTFGFFWTRASAETAGNVRYALKFVNGTDIVWENGSYAKVLITAFKVESWWMSLHLGTESYVEFCVLTSWENATIYVYDNMTLMTTVTESEGGAFSYFWMSETQGLHIVVLNITHGSTVYTRSRTYYIPDWAVTGLVVRWDMWTFQNNYTLITLESNWMNCTYYLYLNDSLVATSYNDPVTLNFTRSLNNGTYNLTIYADGGASTYTIKNIRYIVTEEGVTYDFSSFSGGVTIVEGDTYEGDNVTIHENPTGMFMDQATAAIIAVGGFLIIFTAFLVAREIRKRDQEKTERMYSQ